MANNFICWNKWGRLVNVSLFCFFFIWETIFAVVCMSVLILVMVPYGSKKKGLVEKKKKLGKTVRALETSTGKHSRNSGHSAALRKSKTCSQKFVTITGIPTTRPRTK